MEARHKPRWFADVSPREIRNALVGIGISLLVVGWFWARLLVRHIYLISVMEYVYDDGVAPTSPAITTAVGLYIGWPFMLGWIGILLYIMFCDYAGHDYGKEVTNWRRWTLIGTIVFATIAVAGVAWGYVQYWT